AVRRACAAAPRRLQYVRRRPRGAPEAPAGGAPGRRRRLPSGLALDIEVARTLLSRGVDRTAGNIIAGFRGEHGVPIRPAHVRARCAPARRRRNAMAKDAQPTDKSLDVNGLTLHYLDWGNESAPPMG